jgi:hypothetical protein
MIAPKEAREVLAVLRDKKRGGFSSHDFIEEYCKQNEDRYIDWLVSYRGTGRAFQTVHSLIGRFLSENENHIIPKYTRTMRADSENVHGTIDQPMWWAWNR